MSQRLFTVSPMTKFLHTADWQLGMTRHFLSDEAQARFTAARIEAIASIGALAEEEGCSFVVVGGDVFESNQVERQVVVRSLEAMKRFPRVTFYLLPGNHDPLDASSVFRSKTFLDNRPTNVVVLESSDPLPAADGVEIVGAPWFNKRPMVDLVAGAVTELPSDGTIRVVVGHGGTDSLSPNPDDPALVVLADLEAAIAAGSVHYVALGDRHSTTEVGATGRIFYSGTPEPTDYDEIDPGNVLIVELSDESVTVERHRVGTWRFVRRDFDVTGPEDCLKVEHFLDEISDKARTIVKLALVGQLTLADMDRLETTLHHASDLLGALELWERRSDLVVLPDDDDFGELGFSGFAAEGLDDLRDLGTGSGDDAVTARDALGLLYRLANTPA
jgi:DNA repair exonuclease SbcCD nuclease subunit